MGLTAVGAVITGTVGAMVKSYVQAGDEIKEMAARTGMSTTALSELKYAASLCGSDIRELEVGIKKMSSSLFDAAVAGDQVPNAFTRIGLSTQDLIKLSPEQQFDRIAKALAAVENPTIRAATAVDIFGRSGTKLLPLFSEGPAGMEALRKKAHELGIVFDQEAANKADALNDAITTLKGSFSGIGNVVAGTLMPAITGLVGKITGTIVKMKEWMTAHPGLSSAIFKVVTAMGLLMAAIGPVLIVLPTLVTSLKILAVTFGAVAGPIGVVVAALLLAYGAVKLLEKVRPGSKIDEQTKAYTKLTGAIGYWSDFAESAARREIGTTKELTAVWDKYGQNTQAAFKAIAEGAEGPALKAFIEELGGAHVQAFASADKQADSLTKLKTEMEAAAAAAKAEADAEMLAMLNRENAKTQIEAIIAIRRQLTDEIQKGTLKEYDYQKWALGAAYDERKTQIAKEVTDEKAKGPLLLQAKQSYNAQLTALEESFREKRAQEERAFLEEVTAAENEWWAERLAAAKSFSDQRAQLIDGIKQMTLSELEYKRWALEQERLAEETHIAAMKELSAQQKEELLALLAAYYAQKGALAEADASAEVALAERTRLALARAYTSSVESILGAFQAFGEGTKTILGAVGSAFKGTVNACISALKELVVQELVAAAATILLEKSKAIARVISSVMALPFPLNLLAVGGAIAAVSALFSAIKLGEGGVVMGPTLALVGEAGPEMVIPLKKLGLLAGGAGAAGGASITLNLNSPLIQTTGLSRGQVDELAPYIFNAVESEARRYGFSLKRG